MTEGQRIPTGDITVFLAALAGDARALGRAFALLGPGMESVEHERADGSTDVRLHYPASGGSIRMRAGKPIAIRIPVRSDDGAPTYPAPDALIEGLDGESTRGEVTALLGEPARSSQVMDLYRYGDQFVRFDYQRGRIEVVSLVAACAED